MAYSCGPERLSEGRVIGSLEPGLVNTLPQMMFAVFGNRLVFLIENVIEGGLYNCTIEHCLSRCLRNTKLPN
jgi:hypothetical protein